MEAGHRAGRENLQAFNRKQQGDIIRDYNVKVVYGSTPYIGEYGRMQQQLAKGEL